VANGEDLPGPSTASKEDRSSAAAPAAVTRREILGWCWYDAADSAFTTVIVTALYAPYFGEIVVGDPARADMLWGSAAAISEVAVAILAPILGAIADFSGSRKRFLIACAATVVLFTSTLYFVGPGMWALGLGLFVMANIGYAGGGIFIDSFLPGISNEKNVSRISGTKWAIGYASGLVALGLCFPLARDIESPAARWIPVVVAAYFAIMFLPTLLLLRDRSVAQPLPPGDNYVTVGFRRLGRTLRNVKRHRELVKLLIAFLIYNDGIVTVIYFAGRYATETIGFQLQDLIVLLILMNVVSLIGALSMGFVADWIGQKRTIMISLAIWISAVTVAYFARSKEAFYVAATLVGIGIGSCQSVTRSLVALMVPKTHAAEFFGFFGIAGKALAFAGPMIFGVISLRTGSQRPAILAIAAFFIVGMIVLATVNERQGKLEGLQTNS